MILNNVGFLLIVNVLYACNVVLDSGIVFHDVVHFTIRDFDGNFSNLDAFEGFIFANNVTVDNYLELDKNFVDVIIYLFYTVVNFVAIVKESILSVLGGVTIETDFVVDVVNIFISLVVENYLKVFQVF